MTPEQQELRSLAAELLARRVPPEVPRAYLEVGGDARALWAEVAELGWYAVGLEEDDPFGAPGLCVLALCHYVQYSVCLARCCPTDGAWVPIPGRSTSLIRWCNN